MKADISLINDYVAGALGGVAGLVAGHPLDTVKVQLQVHMSKGGTRQALKDVGKYGLFRGFFRGLSFPVATQAASNSVFYGVYGSSLALIEDGEGGRTAGRRSPSFGQVFVAGCTGGLLQILVSCPTDLIKVVLQSQLSSIQPHSAVAPSYGNHVTSGKGNHVTLTRSIRITSSELRSISSGGTVRYFRGPLEATVWVYRRNGPLGFYRGGGAMVLRDTVTYGLYMVVYEWLYRRLMLSSYTDSGGVMASMLAGGFAGVAAWSTCMPFDVIKSNLQSDVEHTKYRGVIDCAAQVYRRSGLRGFFAGLPVACLRAFPTNAITFLVYSKTLSYLNGLTATDAVATDPAF